MDQWQVDYSEYTQFVKKFNMTWRMSAKEVTIVQNQSQVTVMQSGLCVSYWLQLH
jgi:hypothetical protein